MSREFLPFSKPSISEEAIAEVVACLRSGWITTGPRTQRFEAMLGEYFGVEGVLACSSATAGLLMALLALDLEPGDDVVTSPLTFAATFNTIVLAGGTPVLADIDPATYNISPERLTEAITPRTRAIVPVHFAGRAADLEPIYRLAEERGLRVIEDAAHGIGTEYRGRKIGSFGDTQVFSFHPNKNMTTGEGGCVVTRDAAMRDRMMKLRFHGIDRNAWDRFSKRGLPHYDIALAGYKFNMMDLQAALGLHQLPALDGFLQRRAALAARYLEKLAGLPGLTLPPGEASGDRHAWHLFAPRIAARDGMDRDRFMEALKAREVGTGLHYQAVHLSSYYRERWGFREGQFPEAEAVCAEIVSLPLFPDLSEADQDWVVEVVREVLLS
ncbi:MAG: DegT/DnrJ/EryC1/StrS family aminotransferase [Candidatus Methylacidiphilales bacterium]